MKALLALFCTALAITAAPPLRCIAGDSLPKQIAERLSEKWISEARRHEIGSRVIYEQAHSGTLVIYCPVKNPVGELVGEILILSPTSAVACSKLTVSPAGEMKIDGINYSAVKTGRSALWDKYLSKRNAH